LEEQLTLTTQSHYEEIQQYRLDQGDQEARLVDAHVELDAVREELRALQEKHRALLSLPQGGQEGEQAPNSTMMPPRGLVEMDESSLVPEGKAASSDPPPPKVEQHAQQASAPLHGEARAAAEASVSKELASAHAQLQAALKELRSVQERSDALARDKQHLERAMVEQSYTNQTLSHEVRRCLACVVPCRAPGRA
jgi:hypothetical protein